MRHPRWLSNELPFVLVTALVVCGALSLTIWPDHWRRGVAVFAGAMFVGAALRLLLPPQRAGALAVRGRWFDVLCYLALGGVILAVAIRLH